MDCLGTALALDRGRSDDCRIGDFRPHRPHRRQRYRPNSRNSRRGAASSAVSVSVPEYRATITRTAHDIPHITANSFGSLGFGYGYAFASDDICTIANDYVTVEGERSRYFGPDATYAPLGAPVENSDSDTYWQAVIKNRVVQRLLAVKQGPSAVEPRVRQLIAGYNDYLASVGGTDGISDPTCRGQAWVHPLTVFDEYLRIYQLAEIESTDTDPQIMVTAQPPTTSSPQVPEPSAGQLRELGTRLDASQSAAGSNAIAIGSAGARDHGAGILLGNPHFSWSGPLRFYEVQLTIPGTLNVEGVTLSGIPVVLIGFNSTLAWSHTVSSAHTFVLCTSSRWSRGSRPSTSMTASRKR
jgi:acyl-homoserine-lactone acylase